MNDDRHSGAELANATVSELASQLETPLSAVQGYVEQLARDDSLLSDPADRRQHLAVIRDHVARIADLIDHLSLRLDPEAPHRRPVARIALEGHATNEELNGQPNDQLDLVTHQALRAIQDVRELHAVAKEEQHARELAEAQQLRVVEDFRTLYRRASSLAKQLDQAYLDTITALAKAVEARDQYTSRHVERVRTESMRIARRLGLSDEALRHFEFGAVLHDVGKIGIPDAILGKPGPLTPLERETMRQHPTIGRLLLEGIKFLEPALPAVESHHERWDGLGYPKGLAGEAIPIEGRIVAVADAYDAMTSDRPYRPAMTEELARKAIAEGRGTQFAPDIVDIFLTNPPRDD